MNDHLVRDHKDDSVNRRIIDLALPALGALVAEPLFLMADSAVIGHVGTPHLAGLGVASTVMLTATGLFVFLAYATTASSARRMGSGDRAGAAAAGVDGLWLSVLLGVVVPAEAVAHLFGAQGRAAEYAAQYLRIAGLGVPAMLASMAITGVLRGFQDTRTPLVATVLGFTGNLVLDLVFVLGFGWGCAGRRPRPSSARSRWPWGSSPSSSCAPGTWGCRWPSARRG